MYWNLLLIVLAASNCGLVGAEGPTEDAGVSDSEFFLEYNKLNKKIAEETGVMMVRSSQEEKMRFNIFKSRYPEIKRINKTNAWIAETNAFTIMTDAELEGYLGLNISFRSESEGMPIVAALRDDTKVPEAKDWVKEGKVTDIKAQLDCGSCWAFAAVAALESHYAIKTGTLKMMSEQQVLDCTYADISHDGCKGGWMSTAFKQIVKKMGNKLPSGQVYQYRALADKCINRRNNALIAAKINPKDIFVAYHNEYSEKAAPYGQYLSSLVGTEGPIAVAMQVVNSMYSYASGIYSEKKCLNQVNHAVVVVGYDKDSFLIRNSWGSNWGAGGYIKFNRQIKNQCFISSFLEYPLLVSTGKKDKPAFKTPCNPQPCMNKGRCQSNKEKTDYTCSCRTGFTGKNCQEKAVKCGDSRKKCPKSKTHPKCKRKFFKNNCKMSCGRCFQ